jgi:hypothetical protein
VIGIGVADIYQIKRLVDLGLRAAVLEAAPDLGGPPARERLGEGVHGTFDAPPLAIP